MRTPLIRAAFLTGMLGAVCHGQEARFDDASFNTATVGGLHLYGLSVFTGYSTFAGPTNSLNQLVSAGSARLSGDTTYGATWTGGYQRSRENSSVSVRYSGSYTGQTTFTNLNAFGHSLSIGAHRIIHKKWTVGLSADAEYLTLAQYFYQPTAVSSISQTPATFDNLAAAYGIGRYSDIQSASMLTSNPIASASTSTAGRGLLLGDRMLTYGVQASASYAASSRLSFTFSSFTAGGQNALDNKQATITPRTIGASAGATLSYDLSTRTTFGLSLTEIRSSNQYQGSYGTNAEASLGRKMGPHWFVHGGAGMSYIRITQQISGTAPSKNITGSGSLGYRAYAHTLIVSYNRGSYDTYGLAAGSNTTASGAWNWYRPGSAWRTQASFGFQKLNDTGFATISGWHARGIISRDLSLHISVRGEYTYFDSSGTFRGNPIGRTAHIMRASVVWSPQESNR